jgi:hypothetical protein
LKIIASVFERQKAHLKMSACSTAGRHHRAYLTAEGVGSVAVGQPRLTYVATANYAMSWIHLLGSPTARITTG